MPRWAPPRTACCDRMRFDLEQTCDQHDDPRDCPDHLIYVDREGNYSLPVRDSGHSVVAIRFCPWCGAPLKNLYPEPD